MTDNPQINKEQRQEVARKFPLGKISDDLESFKKSLDGPFAITHIYGAGYFGPTHVDSDGWLWRVRGDGGSGKEYYKHSILTEEQKLEAIKLKIPFRD